MKRIYITLAIILLTSIVVYAEDAPKVYYDTDLGTGYLSSSSSSNQDLSPYYQDRKDSRNQYYQDQKESRGQYYEDRKDERTLRYQDTKEAREQYYDDKKETLDRYYQEKAQDTADREKKREECRREAESKRFWCKSNDKACQSQWTNAYRDCNYIQ